MLRINSIYLAFATSTKPQQQNLREEAFSGTSDFKNPEQRRRMLFYLLYFKNYNFQKSK